MKKLLIGITGIALSLTLAACENKEAAAPANEVVDTTEANVVDANVVDANAMDANAADANAADNAADAGNNTTVHGSTDH